jgi:hypothetical protein
MRRSRGVVSGYRSVRRLRLRRGAAEWVFERVVFLRKTTSGPVAETPNSKHQAPKKLQLWCLEFGVLPVRRRAALGNTPSGVSAPLVLQVDSYRTKQRMARTTPTTRVMSSTASQMPKTGNLLRSRGVATERRKPFLLRALKGTLRTSEGAASGRPSGVWRLRRFTTGSVPSLGTIPKVGPFPSEAA